MGQLRIFIASIELVTGARGAQGVIGDTGATGATGYGAMGDTGATGVTGSDTPVYHDTQAHVIAYGSERTIMIGQLYELQASVTQRVCVLRQHITHITTNLTHDIITSSLII
jgi:hypothetical protein